MSTEIVYRQSGPSGSFVVSLDGFRELSRFFATSDPKMRTAMREGLRDSGQPVLQRARANALSLGGKGKFAASLGVRAYSNGTLNLVSAGDDAAPVKEYAHLGARTITSQGTPLANARLRLHSGVGVPRARTQPRVMIPAANDSVDEVCDHITRRLEEVLGGATNG